MLRHAQTFSDRPIQQQHQQQPPPPRQDQPQYGSPAGGGYHSPSAGYISPGVPINQRVSPRMNPSPHLGAAGPSPRLGPGPSPRLPPSPARDSEANQSLMPLFRAVDRDGMCFSQWPTWTFPPSLREREWAVSCA